MKKYELTDETMEIDGVVLHRIRAVRDFGNIVAGTYGGWIAGESNLSHDGNAWVFHDAKVFGNAEVWGNALVYGNAKVWGNARVYDNAKVWGSARVYGDADIYGDAEVCGNAKILGDADVLSTKHVLVIGAVGSRSDFTTFFRNKDNHILVKCGCFCGTIDKFLEKVEDTHGNGKHALVYKAAAELAKLQIDLSEEAPKEDE